MKKEEIAAELWSDFPEVKKTLAGSADLHDARQALFKYLNSLERELFKVHSSKPMRHLHPVEKNNAKECIRVFKNIIRKENENITGFSAMDLLWRMAKENNVPDEAGEGFLCEVLCLMKGMTGKTGVKMEKSPRIGRGEGRRAGQIRSRVLDTYSARMNEGISKYDFGLNGVFEKQRALQKKNILRYFKGSEKNWADYRWHLKHIIEDGATLGSIVKLEQDEIDGIKAAEKNNIPFQITPYYLSLFNIDGRAGNDRAVRAQVIPSMEYCEQVGRSREEGVDMDFMGEKATSPVECVTRRYPQIVILKPFESCPQICVYCQRNWEIKKIEDAGITDASIKKALRWIKKNPNITEVLVTGGDPLTLDNGYFGWLLEELSLISHVERIRIGTRVPVTLPCRINSGFIKLLKKYHSWGRREICIITHFEHTSEMTGEALKAIKKIKNTGVNIYNQQVFTYYNSRRFESCALRKTLKISGIDPYYTFNTKGKEETTDFRVPIARVEQERKEEARLLSGVVRTDEPVFNVPKLGKSHLRAWQEHEVIMILADGSRVYRFYPWESGVLLSDVYLYTDIPIYSYLLKLHGDGEDTEEYGSIWYYF